MNGVRCLLTMTLLATVGCGGQQSSTGVSKRDYGAVRALSVGYEGYLRSNRGQAPKDEQALRTYLQSRQSDWDAVGITIDDMFKSPLSGEQLVVIYGKKPPSGKTGLTYVAYAKEPVDGKRLVIATRGLYEQLDEAQFKSLFPDAL